MSLFALPTELKSTSRDVTRFYYEIDEANTHVDALNAKTVNMHTFKIMKDGNRFWVPSRSYFKIKIAMMRYGLDQKDGIRATAESNRPVLLGDTVAPILNFPSAMFKNVRFFIGPDKVSDVSTNLALISTVKDRVTKSSSWLSTLGLPSAKSLDPVERRKLFVPPEVKLCRDLHYEADKLRVQAKRAVIGIHNNTFAPPITQYNRAKNATYTPVEGTNLKNWAWEIRNEVVQGRVGNRL